MSVELLPDSRHYADELLALRRDNAALKVALADKDNALNSLRIENAELRFTAARFADRVRAICREMVS